MPCVTKDNAPLVANSDSTFTAGTVDGGDVCVQFGRSITERKNQSRLRCLTIAYIVTASIFIVLFLVCFVLLAWKFRPDDTTKVDDLESLRREIEDLKLTQSPQVQHNESSVIFWNSELVRKLASMSGWYSGPLTNGTFYRLFTSTKTWDGADTQCRRIASRLAVTGMRNDTIRSDIIANTVIGSTMHVWIGLEEQTDDGVWSWVDGVASNITDPYWDSGQPESFRGRRDCGNLEYRKQWKIHDRRCSEKLHYLCEL